MPEPFSLTTLELAEKIAQQVVGAESNEEGAFRVLKVLRANGCWFCRLSETDQGTVQTVLPWGE